MSKPTIRIHNIETDEVIDREMTDSELDQFELDQAQAVQRQIESEEKIKAKLALLDKLGITEDEAALLLS